MLERELAQRGVTRSPLELELTLDHLWDTPAERMRTGVRGLKALGRLGRAVTKVIREGELPDLSRPQWLEPGIDERLERIHQAARPRIMSWTRTGCAYRGPMTRPAASSCSSLGRPPPVDRVNAKIPSRTGIVRASTREPHAPAVFHR